MLLRLPARRPYSTQRPRSGHGDFYASLLPAMIPVALLGSAVYMTLHLVQSRLAHEKFLDGANERIRALQEQIDSLQTQRPSVAQQVPSPKKSSWW